MFLSGIFSEHSKQHLGQILIDQGALTIEQLQHALAIQEQKGGRIGWILLKLGYISQAELSRAMAEQLSLDMILSKQHLGEILIDQGALTVKQLQKALAVQRIKGGRIGWILLNLGYISRSALAEAMAEQLSLDQLFYKHHLGEILIEQGALTVDQLQKALAIQQEKGGHLGWILLSLGYISRLDFFKALAEQLSMELVLYSPDLVRSIDKELIRKMNFSEVSTHHLIPVSINGDELTILTDYPNLEGIQEFCTKRFHVKKVRSLLVTDLDFMKFVQKLYGRELIDKSINGLLYRNHEESAYSVFTKKQVIVFGIFLYAALIWLYLDASSFLVCAFSACQLIFFITVCYKLVLSLAGAAIERHEFITKEEVQAISDDHLPVYTILVPVYKEPEVIHILVDSLKKMDYPQSRLDILLLLEEDDDLTLQAAREAAPPGNWRFITVPDALPKTKPKACNYGVFFSRGEFLTIYDAEDIPEPDQLKKAVIGFQKYGESYVCLQAALNYFNAEENLITKLFTLEYSYWFDYLLPGLDHFHLPIPLGGTSNHFRTNILKELGAWDPFNVTEDADLGIRACANGYRVGIINSTTLEEANSRYGNWIRQRSRWIKGYMQTILVYNRHPLKMLKVLGPVNWLSFQLFIGGAPLLFLITPIVWGLFLFWLFTRSTSLEALSPPLIVYIGLFNLLLGNFMGIYLNMMAVFRRKLFKLQPVALLNPFYWLAGHSVAAYKALVQLFHKPFYWEKTEHGLTKVSK